MSSSIPDPRLLEHAADRIVALCDELGLDRKEVATVTSAIFLNHAVATGVPLQRCVMTVHAMYRLREHGVNPKVLARKGGA